ncbi:probable elongation factor 1-delta isoform X1 [Anopheles bellator]|uniref:probable elongation factor 1-delta isoform X1 n=1 Tax=Anopheles bellator TaxID=139047 RepID=UPI00264815C3|nr:probable elongation factor 1-delta isoform X1 [Anopheles bellator]
MAATALAHEKVWIDRNAIASAEKKYYEYLSKLSVAEKKMEPNDGVEADATEPKIEQLKKSTASQRSPPEATAQQQLQNPVNAAPGDPSVVAADAPKSKRDKKKRNRGKKESAPVTDNELSDWWSDATPVAPAPQPEAPVAPVAQPEPEAEFQKEWGKKKSKKSKKSKWQETEAATELVAEKQYDESAMLVQQQNAKNQKEKENLSHKLCDNITEELNKINSAPSQCTLASEISKARQHIKNSLERMDGIAALAASPGAELLDRLSSVEKENEQLRSIIDGLNNLVLDLHERVKSLESGKTSSSTAKPAAAAPAKKAPAVDEDEDDDVDLFGSEDEDEDAAAVALREKRLADYAAKKSKKPVLIAKSNVILDIKPWDDETDMKEMEQQVRKISADGLLLGAAKLVPLAYGIHKLQMSCVIEDDKISVDWLQEEIEKIEDFVQSVDIAAFNKI